MTTSEPASGMVRLPRNCSMTPAEYQAYIKAEVEKAPRLSAEQKDKLWVLLAPAREHLARKRGRRGAA